MTRPTTPASAMHTIQPFKTLKAALLWLCSLALLLAAIPAFAATTITLAANLNPSTSGASVTFTATITGSTPTGTVTFKDGATALGGPVTLSGTGNTKTATYATTSLAAGSHSITAAYAGDANNTASTSTPLGEIVTAALLSTPMTWQYGYDAMDRPTITTDPYGKSVYTYYDSLGRPRQTQQAVGAGNAITQFTYNAADDLTKVTDPRNLSITYNPTGLGTVTSQTSPDTATTTATYDANRNLTKRTDARGKATTFTYDSKDRLKTVHYQTGTDTVFEYDGGATPLHGAIGHLSKITDESGGTSYSYDSAGRLTTKTQMTSNGSSFTTRYTWGDSGSALDKLIAVTYPSGNRVNYAYSAAGEVASITVNKVNANGVGFSATTSNLLGTITRNAASQITGWTWSSGKTEAISYDPYGQPKTYKLGDPAGTGISAGTTRTIGYDGKGLILSYSHVNSGANQPTLNQSFGYDDLSRLTTANLANSSIQYSYDLNGNRTSKVISGTAYNNTVSPTSNKLTQVQDGLGIASIQYDAAGNITNDGVNTYTYSDRGRLSSVTTAGGVVSYKYNGLEQRTYKSGPTSIVPTGAAYYVYNEAGQLLGEYDATGAPIYETIYLGATPVNVLKQTGTAAASNIATSVYNVYSDHLATPRVITRGTDEAIVWRWDSAEAFGATAPNQNPNNLGTFTYNQRLPGQVFDAETGLFQNWHRTYNARLGRYIESDPIGLRGGINTYLYVGGNPLSFVDTQGLMGQGGALGTKVSPKVNPLTTLAQQVSKCLCQLNSRFCVNPKIISAGTPGLIGIIPQIFGINPDGETTFAGNITVSSYVYGSVPDRPIPQTGVYTPHVGVLDLAILVAHESLHMTQQNFLQRMGPEVPAIENEAQVFVAANIQNILDCLNGKCSK
jgi:RHS repeat-associated protein